LIIVEVAVDVFVSGTSKSDLARVEEVKKAKSGT